MKKIVPLLLLVFAAQALAERVHTKAGNEVMGPITETPDYVDVRVSEQKIIRVPRASIAWIESDEAPERRKEVKLLLDGAWRHKRQAELALALAKIHDAFVIPALLDRLEHASSVEERRLAIRELEKRGCDQVVRGLARAVVLDGTGAVRSDALAALKKIGNRETGRLFTQALGRSDPHERVRATAALATFPDKDAMGVLANLGNPASGADNNSSRSHIYVGTERAYISGWELSSGGTGLAIAEVAKPTIDVLREGVVLEVSARYIIEYETFVRGSVMRFLSGEKKESFAAWEDWWKKAGPTFELSKAAKEQLASLGP